MARATLRDLGAFEPQIRSGTPSDRRLPHHRVPSKGADDTCGKSRGAKNEGERRKRRRPASAPRQAPDIT